MTTYIIRTNGIEHVTAYTVKAKALKAAEDFSDAAVLRNEGDLVEVVTEARGKVVYSFRNEIDVTREDFGSNVTVVGEYTEPEDAFASIAEQTAWQRQEDVCMGLCAIGTGCEHCDTNFGHFGPQTDAESIEEIPVEEAPMAEKFETVSVVQEHRYSAGIVHYHAPGCRDIGREVLRYSSEAFTAEFESVMDILIAEFGNHASDNAEEGTPAWYSSLFENATGDRTSGVRIMPCLYGTGIPLGETNDGSPLVTQGNFFRSGFKRPSVERTDDPGDAGFIESDSEPVRDVVEGDESSRQFPCIKVNGRVTHKGDCAERFGFNGPVCSLANDPEDYSDAPLADWERELLASVQPKHTEEIPQDQGWIHYEHTVTQGDVVKVTGKQGVYVVHCVVPGVDVVYLLGTEGEPSPYPAHSVYAL